MQNGTKMRQHFFKMRRSKNDNNTTIHIFVSTSVCTLSYSTMLSESARARACTHKRIAHLIVFNLARNMRCQWITTWCIHIIGAWKIERQRIHPDEGMLNVRERALSSTPTFTWRFLSRTFYYFAFIWNMGIQFATWMIHFFRYLSNSIDVTTAFWKDWWNVRCCY